MKKYLLVVVGFILGIVCTGYASYKLKAEQVSFDKSNTDLNSNDVQSVIDELATEIKENSITIKSKTYSINTTVLTYYSTFESVDVSDLQWTKFTGAAVIPGTTTIEGRPFAIKVYFNEDMTVATIQTVSGDGYKRSLSTPGTVTLYGY